MISLTSFSSGTLSQAIATSPTTYSVLNGYSYSIGGSPVPCRAALEALSTLNPTTSTEARSLRHLAANLRASHTTPDLLSYFRGDRAEDMQEIFTRMDGVATKFFNDSYKTFKTKIEVLDQSHSCLTDLDSSSALRELNIIRQEISQTHIESDLHPLLWHELQRLILALDSKITRHFHEKAEEYQGKLSTFLESGDLTSLQEAATLFRNLEAVKSAIEETRSHFNLDETQVLQLDALTTRLDAKVSDFFEAKRQERLPLITASTKTRLSEQRAKKFIKSTAITHVRKAIAKKYTDAALKIQRAFIRKLHKRAASGEIISAMKVERPLMRKLRSATIRQHERGDFDRLFYRYMDYAKKTRDLKSLQRLSFAMLSFTPKKSVDHERALLANLFVQGNRRYCSTIGVLMTSLKRLYEKDLAIAVSKQSTKWVDETSLVNFSNPEGTIGRVYDHATGDMVDGLVEINEFFPWKNERDGEWEINFNHSGGRYHLEEFLDGVSKGYPLEGRYGASRTHGHGIQVHPCDVSFDRMAFYARKAYGFFDEPSILRGKISSKWLQDCPNRSYEAGLRAEFKDHITEPTFQDLDASTWDYRLPYWITPHSIKELIQDGCQAAYHTYYGNFSLYARVSHLVKWS